MAECGEEGGVKVLQGSWGFGHMGPLMLPRRGPPVGMEVHGWRCQAHPGPGGVVLIARFAPAPSPHLVLLGTPPAPHTVRVCVLLVGRDAFMCSCTVPHQPWC